MIEYVKKKIEQLLDSLIEPIWKTILVSSWMTRLLVLLVLAGVAYALSFPESVKSAYALSYGLARVMWAGESRIPMSSEIAQRTKDVGSRLLSSLEPDLDLPPRGDITPWFISQASLAAYRFKKPPNAQRVVSFFRGRYEHKCSCWREIPGNTGRARTTFVSGWILRVLADMGTAGTKGEIHFLLDEQHQDGWWSVFPVNPASQYASAYGTGWVLLGLNAQLKKGLVDADEQKRVIAAIQKGSAWLSLHREPGARWKDYPLLRDGKPSESISGVVLHALHQTVPQQLHQIDGEWLDNLPPTPTLATDADHPYVYIQSKDGYVNDDFVQIRLPWLLIGTADAYHNGNMIQRAKALTWLENALDHPSVLGADTTPANWWRAELLFAIAYVLERI